MNHHCHAINCSKNVKPELLMCLKHWKMVPSVIQKEVLLSYVEGQCDKANPSREWLIAARKAINYVFKLEGGKSE